MDQLIKIFTNAEINDYVVKTRMLEQSLQVVIEQTFPRILIKFSINRHQKARLSKNYSMYEDKVNALIPDLIDEFIKIEHARLEKQQSKLSQQKINLIAFKR